MTRVLRIVAVTAAFVLVVAACGDSGGDAPDSTPAATSGQQSTSAPTSPPDTQPDDTSPDTVDTLGTIPDDLLGVSDECIAVANVFLAIASASMAFLDPSAIDPDTAIGDFDDLIGQLPSELQADATTLAQGLSSYFAGLAELGIDFSDPNAMASLSAAQLQALEELTSSLDSDEFNDAADALDAYATANCDEPGG